MNKKSSIFDRLVNFVAALHFGHAILFTAAIGTVVIYTGCAYEAVMQNNLLINSGPAALDAYLTRVDSHQLSILQFFIDSVSGRCYAISAFWQGTGFWIFFVLTPVVGSSVLLARRTVRMTEKQAHAVLAG